MATRTSITPEWLAELDRAFEEDAKETKARDRKAAKTLAAMREKFGPLLVDTTPGAYNPEIPPREAPDRPK